METQSLLGKLHDRLDRAHEMRNNVATVSRGMEELNAQVPQDEEEKEIRKYRLSIMRNELVTIRNEINRTIAVLASAMSADNTVVDIIEKILGVYEETLGDLNIMKERF